MCHHPVSSSCRPVTQPLLQYPLSVVEDLLKTMINSEDYFSKNMLAFILSISFDALKTKEVFPQRKRLALLFVCYANIHC